MSSDSDPIASVAKGSTKAVLEYTEEKAIVWTKKFLNKDLAFIERPETIDLAKSERNTPEMELYRTFVQNKDYRILIQTGLTLRKLEGKPELLSLRDNIKNKYGEKGLHIAEFVQNKVIGDFVKIVIEKSPSVQVIRATVEDLLENIDKYVLFVRSSDPIETRVSELNMRLQVLRPQALILFGSGTAIKITESITSRLQEKIPDYDCFRFAENYKVTCIFFRNYR